MANLKKNQLANIIFPLVDGTDFASVESGITASNADSKLTKKFFGVNHGGSTAFTSGTISKALTLVRSGVYQQTLKATETNYDYVMYSFIPNNASVAHQMLVFQTVDYDDSDIMSRISDVGSDLLSYLVGMSGMLSDIRSNVSDLQSDFQSRVPKLVATFSRLSDYHSDLRSYLLIMSGVQSDVYSLLSSRVDKQVAARSQLSDLHSDLRSYLVGMSDQISNVQSTVDSQFVWTSAFLSDMNSDLSSQIGEIGAGTITVSDISDIASAVWANTIGTRVDSRILLIQSNVSDVESALDRLDEGLILSRDTAQTGGTQTITLAAGEPATNSLFADAVIALVGGSGVGQVRPITDYNGTTKIAAVYPDWEVQPDNTTSYVIRTNYQSWRILSDMNSDTQSLMINLASSTALTASSISDIADWVWSHATGVQVDSRILVIQSLISDVDSQLLLTDSQVTATYSLLSDHYSDFQSRVTGTLATSNQLSAAESNLLSYLAGMSNTISTVYELVSDVDSALTLHDANMSNAVSDIRSYLVGMSGALSDVESQVDLLATSNYLSQVESNLYSAIGNVSVTLTQSDISDIASATAAAISTISASDISDIASAVWANTIGARVDSRIVLIQSNVSDTQSALDSQFVWTSAFLSDMNSDLSSQIGGITAGVSASDISDIASAVWANTIGTRVDSRIVLIQSNVSDTQSALDSQFAYLSNALSDIQSDLTSQIGGISAGGVTVSNISDIASAVWADTIGARVDSRIVLIQSNVSDIDSQLTVTHSLLSDVDSALTLHDANISGMISDVDSQLTVTDSKVTLIQSNVSDVESQLDVTHSLVSDIDSQLTVTHSLLSDVESQLDLTASNVSDIESQLDVTHSLLSDVESAVDAIWTTALTESYNADGAAATAAQLLYGIFQNLTEFAINSTTITVKKLDGSTSAMTFTLDDDTNPTSRTRAT